MKKIVSTLAVTSLLATIALPATSFAAAKNFTDTKPLLQSSQKSIQYLQGIGIVSGYPDGSFKPHNNITRAEFAAIMVNMLELKPKSDKVEFADVKQNDWNYSVLKAAMQNGLLNGVEVKKNKVVMNPNGEITRAEMMAIVTRADRLMGNQYTATEKDITDVKEKYAKDFNKVPVWAQKVVTESVESSLISGISEDELGPLEKGTREQSSLMVGRLMERAQLYKNLKTEGAKVLAEQKVDTKEVELKFNKDYSVDYAYDVFYGTLDKNGLPKQGVFVKKLNDSNEFSTTAYKTLELLYVEDAQVEKTIGALYENSTKISDGNFVKKTVEIPTDETYTDESGKEQHKTVKTTEFIKES